MGKKLEVVTNSSYITDLGNIKKDIQAGKVSYSLSEIENMIEFVINIEGKIFGNKIAMVCSIVVILLSFFSGFWYMFLGIGLLIFIGISNSKIQQTNDKIVDVVVLYKKDQLGVTRVSHEVSPIQVKQSQSSLDAHEVKTRLLLELNDLKLSGALTEEEFQAEKKKILSK
jgi:hypothetical protein